VREYSPYIKGTEEVALLIDNIYLFSQKDPMEESIEIVLEKVVQMSKDICQRHLSLT
jgi:hypothetical protein